MNYKLELAKDRLKSMLHLIESQEAYEDIFDFDTKGIKENEEKVITEFSAEAAALMQIISGDKSNAFVIGDLTIS